MDVGLGASLGLCYIIRPRWNAGFYFSNDE